MKVEDCQSLVFWSSEYILSSTAWVSSSSSSSWRTATIRISPRTVIVALITVFIVNIIKRRHPKRTWLCMTSYQHMLTVKEYSICVLNWMRCYNCLALFVHSSVLDKKEKIHQSSGNFEQLFTIRYNNSSK